MIFTNFQTAEAYAGCLTAKTGREHKVGVFGNDGDNEMYVLYVEAL